MKSRYLLVFGLLLLLFASSGCFYATFQTPEVIRPGHVTVGLGGAFGMGQVFREGEGHNSHLLVETDLYARVGVLPNMDVGARLAIPLGVMADVKYQLLRAPVLLAMDFGMSYAEEQGTQFGKEVNSTYLNFYPMLIGGTKHVYAGLKTVVILENDKIAGRTINHLYPGLVLGAALGRRLKLMPELNLYLGANTHSGWPETIVHGVLGLQFTF